MDGSFNLEGLGGGMVTISPEGIVTKHGLRLEFLATNETEYEALIKGLGLAKELEVQDLRVYSDLTGRRPYHGQL